MVTGGGWVATGGADWVAGDGVTGGAWIWGAGASWGPGGVAVPI